MEQLHGNGARCFALYVREQGLTDKDVIEVGSRARAKSASLCTRLTAVSGVNMGVPELEPAKIILKSAGEQLCHQSGR